MNRIRSAVAALVVFLGALAGCTLTTSVVPPAKDITGSWQWFVSTGGIAGDTRTPASDGYTLRIGFRSDGMYQEYKNGILIRRTRFTILREPTLFHSALSDVIHYSDGLAMMPQEVTLVGTDTLRLSDLCNDCYIHMYSRIP